MVKNHLLIERKRTKRMMLLIKLFRDFQDNFLQFISIMLLCALGTWAFSGLDGTWRMMDASVGSYFDQNNLADFWVHGSAFSKEDLQRLRYLPHNQEVQLRYSAEWDVENQGDNVSLLVHAYDGQAQINKPIIIKGTLPRNGDMRAMMVDDQYAKAHKLSIGDDLVIKIGQKEQSFIIRAFIRTPEHLVFSKNTMPDPFHYGFALIDHLAIQDLPYNEALITLKPGADENAAVNAITELMPSTLIITRQTGSTAQINGDISLFRSLSYLFPLMVFAVAALVVMTTLTRMLENQRMSMGTLKALGYSDHEVRLHYLAYAAYPSAFGAFLGIISGHFTLPYVLWEMEAAFYTFPWKKNAPISLPVWIVGALALILSLLICLNTYQKAARETTASLLRAKIPHMGNRVLLEKIPALWRRFSFNTKMVIRNLVRNKWRSILSMVGILCCNMLIICSLGLQESISFFVSRYYGGTMHYELRADLEPEAGKLESFRARLQADRIEGVMDIHVGLHSAHQMRATAITVIEEDQQLLRLGKNNNLIPIPKTGIAVSQKLMETMKLQLGDAVRIYLPGNDKPLKFQINEIAYTNFNQQIFMGRSQWESLRKGAFMPTALLFDRPSAQTLEKLNQMDEVSEIKYPKEQYDQTMTKMDSTKSAFSILTAVAFGLAFVIFYNTGLINFMERTRDYATLKVLGYHQKEIRGLMIKESNLIALCGVLLGIAPGILLTNAIMKLCETEMIVFSANISLYTMLSASIMSFVFSWFIQRLLTRKVRSINMIEALKSVE